MQKRRGLEMLSLFNKSRKTQVTQRLRFYPLAFYPFIRAFVRLWELSIELHQVAVKGRKSAREREREIEGIEKLSRVMIMNLKKANHWLTWIKLPSIEKYDDSIIMRIVVLKWFIIYGQWRKTLTDNNRSNWILCIAEM